MQGKYIFASIALICAILGGLNDMPGWGWFLFAAVVAL